MGEFYLDCRHIQEIQMGDFRHQRESVCGGEAYLFPDVADSAQEALELGEIPPPRFGEIVDAEIRHKESPHGRKRTKITLGAI